MKVFAEKFFGLLNDLVDRAVILIFLIVFLLGCYSVADTAYVFYHATAGNIRGKQQEQSVEEIMLELSDEAVAWLTIDNTTIDYPIMQAENNSKYLNTDPYGGYSLAGSIFLDYRNAADFSDYYSITYGHHMSSGLMFGALDDFEDKKFFDEHRIGTLTIAGKEYRLNIFAFAVMQATEQEIFNPEYADDVDQYIKTRATIYYPPGDGNIVLLSTCRDPGATTRTLVFAEIVNRPAKELDIEVEIDYRKVE